MDASAAASEPLLFIVGPRRREFTIHSVVVARQSSCLQKLVRSASIEGNERSVNWEDVDEETFVCFWQYAYTGDYDIPREPNELVVTMKEEGRHGDGMQSTEHSSEPCEKAVMCLEFEDQVDEDFLPLGGKKNRQISAAEPIKHMPSSKRELLWDLFTKLRLTSSRQVEPSEEQESKGCRFDAVELLCHARVYEFADRYGVVKLMELSHDRLRQSLRNLHLDMDTLGDIIALLQYCYECPAPYDLQYLVVLYAACNIETLWGDYQFQHIVGAHCDLSRLIITLLLSRLD